MARIQGPGRNRMFLGSLLLDSRVDKVNAAAMAKEKNVSSCSNSILVSSLACTIISVTVIRYCTTFRRIGLINQNCDINESRKLISSI